MAAAEFKSGDDKVQSLDKATVELVEAFSSRWNCNRISDFNQLYDSHDCFTITTEMESPDTIPERINSIYYFRKSSSIRTVRKRPPIPVDLILSTENIHRIYWRDEWVSTTESFLFYPRTTYKRTTYKQLSGRMAYKKKGDNGVQQYFYFLLTEKCSKFDADYNAMRWRFPLSFSCLFVTADVDAFVNLTQPFDRCNSRQIYELMNEDGVDVDKHFKYLSIATTAAIQCMCEKVLGMAKPDDYFERLREEFELGKNDESRFDGNSPMFDDDLIKMIEAHGLADNNVWGGTYTTAWENPRTRGRMTKWESRSTLETRTLPRDFTFKFKDIDRAYYNHGFSLLWEKIYELLGRLTYRDESNNRPHHYYFMLRTAWYDESTIGPTDMIPAWSYLYITADVNVFRKIIDASSCEKKKNKIYARLMSDGVRFSAPHASLYEKALDTIDENNEAFETVGEGTVPGLVLHEVNRRRRMKSACVFYEV